MNAPTPPSEPTRSDPVDAELAPDPAPAPPTAPRTPESSTPDVAAPDYDNDVPSLDHVRRKIESRFAASIGATELAEATPQGRTLEDQETERDRAATARLDEIRRTLGR